MNFNREIARQEGILYESQSQQLYKLAGAWRSIDPVDHVVSERACVWLGHRPTDMSGIADKIRLYNEAYQEAWARMSAVGTGGEADSVRLDKAIRILIQLGRSSASDIASEAIRLCRIK